MKIVQHPDETDRRQPVTYEKKQRGPLLKCILGCGVQRAASMRAGDSVRGRVDPQGNVLTSTGSKWWVEGSCKPDSHSDRHQRIVAPLNCQVFARLAVGRTAAL